MDRGSETTALCRLLVPTVLYSFFFCFVGATSLGSHRTLYKGWILPLKRTAKHPDPHEP